MRASIDIGSNSVLLLAGELREGQFFEKLNEANITGLGKNLDEESMFSKKSMDKTFDVLKKYKKMLTSFDLEVEKTIVTATEASRVAINAAAFYEKVKKELGFSVKVITSEGEAYYTGLGISGGYLGEKKEHIVVMDIGGASTELIKLKLDPFKILSSVSLPMGSVRATDWLKNKNFEKKIEEVMSLFPLVEYETSKIICVAGTMTSLAAMIKGLSFYKDQLIHGQEFDFIKFNGFIDKLKKLNPSDILNKFPLIGKRFETITGGGIVGVEIGKALNVKKFSISTYGLRYGTLFEGAIHGRYISKEF